MGDVARAAAARPVTARASGGAQRVCGVVLAGGRSRRMGRDKAALEWNGTTMLAAVVAALRSRLPLVVIVAAEGQELPVLTGMPDADIAVVTDRVPGQGPLRGLEAGLSAAAGHGYDWAVAVATDMPLLTGSVVALLRDAAIDSEPHGDAPGGAVDAGDAVDAVVTVAGGRNQPLAAAYRSGLAEAMGEALASGTRSLHRYLRGVHVRTVVLEGESAGAVTNVNTPEDVEQASRPRPRG